MLFQIVVARYNENISYLTPFEKVCIIYNKGDDNIQEEFINIIKLPNIGRESHTYLYHIINNYDNLADNTIFIQGNITDHKLLEFKQYIINKDFTGKLSMNDIKILKNNINHKGKYLKDLHNGNLKKSKYIPYYFMNNILGLDLKDENKINIVWGANFSVSKELIYKKPIEYYKNIIKYVEYDSNPEEGHFFERSWYLIFNHPKFIPKKTILYSYFNENMMNLLETRNNLNEIHIWFSSPSNYNKNYIIKYVNNLQYIEIFPHIIDNSFQIKISNDTYILFEFYNDKYELYFENNIVNVYHYNTDKIILSTKYKKKIKNNYIKFSWNNDTFKINNILEFPIQLFNYLTPKKIMIRGEKTLIDYEILVKENINVDSNPKILFFYTNNEKVDNDFYLNNYQNYYTIEYC